MLDYISILAGGTCKTCCSFCVGKHIRDDSSPHFASSIIVARFLNTWAASTKKLSISGSTSDPLYVPVVDSIIDGAGLICDYKISLHTCALDILLERDEDFTYNLDGLSLSLHSIPDKRGLNFIARHKGNTRISVVYHEGSESIIDSMEFFDAIPATEFTVRKNVFDPKAPLLRGTIPAGSIFNQPRYAYGEKRIVVWDFADANKHIDARYLWPNGMVQKQCFWHSLHREDD